MSSRLGSVGHPDTAGHPDTLVVTKVAWLPDERSNHDRWTQHQESAVLWVKEQARAEGVRPLLVVNESRGQAHDAVAELAGAHGFVTADETVRAPAAVLALGPDVDSLRTASTLAKGSSLCVIEDEGNNPLIGWAAAVRAHDVSGLYSGPPVINAEAAFVIDSSLQAFEGGGWRDEVATAALHAELGDVVRQGLVDVDILVSYALAYDHVGARSAKTLKRELARYEA